MPQHAILYGTVGCHLCEAANAVLSPAVTSGQLQLQEIDIIDSDALQEIYGLRIPVLKLLPSGAELGWPFDEQSAAQFLAGHHEP